MLKFRNKPIDLLSKVNIEGYKQSLFYLMSW